MTGWFVARAATPQPSTGSSGTAETPFRGLALRCLACALAALSLANSYANGLQGDAVPDADLATAVLTERYGAAAEAAATRCWHYVHAEYGPYCVRLLKVQWIGSGRARRLYLLADGAPMRPDGTVEPLPAHARPGLVGVFLAVISASGKPKVLAGTDAFMFGSFGDSGAFQAKFTQIGADYHGWVFSSGGTWQGISVGWYHILAPRGGQFVDLSEIPTMREEDQDHRYSIEFVSARRGVYALAVTQLSDAPGAKPERFAVPFNYRDWRYEMPRSLSIVGQP